MQKAGRSKLGGESLSRLKFNCVVASCSTSARSDALKRHYLNTVRFDEAGQPLQIKSTGYSHLTVKQKEHTKYFRENKFSRLALPPLKKPAVSESSVSKYFQPKPSAAIDSDEDEPPAKHPRLQESCTDGVDRVESEGAESESSERE